MFLFVTRTARLFFSPGDWWVRVNARLFYDEKLFLTRKVQFLCYFTKMVYMYILSKTTFIKNIWTFKKNRMNISRFTVNWVILMSQRLKWAFIIKICPLSAAVSRLKGITSNKEPFRLLREYNKELLVNIFKNSYQQLFV